MLKRKSGRLGGKLAVSQINDKDLLRKRFKAVRANLDTVKRKRLDDEIFRQFMLLPQYARCKDLLIYVSGSIEVGTIKIIENALGEKNVYCPVCISGTPLMNFHKIESLDMLERGAYNILEPNSKCEIARSFHDPICVVPALSYDELGYRLGFGKGYYDRFLADFNGVKIGLCYENCLTGNLPHDRFDVRADMLVTEKRVISFPLRKDD